MTIAANKSVAAIAAVAVGLALALSFFAPSAQAATCPYTWSTNLKQGSSGADVKMLQMFLNQSADTQVAATGAGSPGNETSTFGGLTKAAVIKFQNKYTADVLTPNGLTTGTGFFGASSRAKANALCTGSTSTTPTPTPGTGLTVSAPTQPMNSLAPASASRVPFTKVTLTAGNDGDVTVNSIQVQRTGFGQDAAFQGVILIDDATGMQIGVAKTFNSNHQAAVGGTVVIPKGTSKTFTIAGNMATSLASYAGEAPAMSVIGVNTSATVSGSLPITGAYHTINATLTVGSLSLDVSNAFASNSNASKEIGTTNYKFTGFRLTAGSSEDVRLKSITFNQAGSVSSSDMQNVMITVGGTSYPTTLSTDGRYYTATFGNGILIGKGNQVDAYISGDIVGSNSSGRTVIFDVDKTTDIYATGETYGYGISPTTAGGSSVPAARTTTGLTTETTGSPYIYAAQITVSGASVTTISKANEVPAQNIAINLSNQPLGGFVVDIKGENMTVQSTVFTLSTSTASLGGVVTNVTLVDQNGAVVAGPVDATGSASTQTVTFTDTITYKTGRSVFTLRGKIPTTATNGAVITAATTPSTGWTNVRGETTGNTISLSTFSSSISLNAMTVKAGSIAVGRSSSPASQTIVPGGSSTLFVNLQFDATQSGEDVRFSSVPTTLTYATGVVTELTGCQLFDGATALNTGTNVVNPSGSSPASATFTLDNPVTVAKGTVKTLGLRCDVSGSATNAGTWAWDSAAASSYTFTGATSGTTVTGSDASDATITVTIGAAAVTVATDASTPSYMIASAGSTNVTNGVFKFRASNENVNLTKLGLSLTNSASSTSGDLVKVSIFDGATKVGEAYFTGSGTVATSTFSSPVVLSKDVDKSLTVKLDLADVGTSQAVTFSGHLIAVDFLNAEGVGASSGSTLFPTGSTAVSGTRVMKSFPTFSLDTLSGTGVNDGKLLRFKVTADAKGPVGITEFNVNLATTTLSVTNVNIYGFSDSGYSTPISGVSSNGQLEASDNTVPANGNVEVAVQTSAAVATVLQVPAGETRYFEVRGSVSGATSGASATTKLLGDSSFATSAASSNSTNPLSSTTGNLGTASFIWSPNTTTTASRNSQDWANGFGVLGLPSGGLTQTRSQ